MESVFMAWLSPIESGAQRFFRRCLASMKTQHIDGGTKNVLILKCKQTDEWKIDDQDSREARCMQIRRHSISQCKNAAPATQRQIDSSDTLVAIFREAHKAKPPHVSFKTPGQAQQFCGHFEVPLQYFNSTRYEKKIEAKHLIHDPECDLHDICQRCKGRRLLHVVKRKQFFSWSCTWSCLHCIAIAILWIDTVDTTFALRRSISGAGKSIVLTTSCSNPPYNFAHTSTLNAFWRHRYNAAKKSKQTPPATAAQTRYLSLSAAAPHPKTFEATFAMRHQKTGHHYFRSWLLPFVTTCLRHHFPSSLPLPQPRFITTSLHHLFPSSPLPFVSTHVHHHFPSLPLPPRHHFPSTPLPFFITSHPNHIPSSPPCVIASYSFRMYCLLIYHHQRGQFHRFLFFWFKLCIVMIVM